MKKKTWKRLRRPDATKRVTAKRLRNSGEAYKNYKGEGVEGKKFVNNKDCRCRLKCSDSLTEEERKSLFDKFYSMADFSRQNAYLCGLIHQAPVSMKRPRDGSRHGKQSSNTYHLQVAGNTVRKCKQYFIDTFVVSNGRVNRVLKKMQSGKSPGEDLRGKHPSSKKFHTILSNVS